MQFVKTTLRAALVFVPVALVASCASSNDGTGEREVTNTDRNELSAISQLPHAALCGDAGPGKARCFGRVRTDVHGLAVKAAAPQGLSPADLKSAYNLPSTGGAGTTIAIVDAYNAPNAEKDLGIYRAQFGLPPCTTANGCFKKVNQNGVAGSYPINDSGWAGEIALDVDMASAICPNCKILLVEADTADMANLGAAVNTAVAMGAAVVSNSYGGPEDSTIVADSESYFNHPGVIITASTGDSGYGASFPASSQYVLAVGGTSLVKSSTAARGWAEGAWSGAGSGCSAFIGKPSWQKDAKCAKRAMGDVSAVADPNTGPATYDGGWQVVGGTSASAPIVAAIYALTGHGASTGSFTYDHATSFYDVKSGSNGSCGGTYLCTSVVGYDGPTGLGTPNATALLAAGGSSGGGGDAGTVDSGGGGIDAGGGTVDSGGGGATCGHAICTTGTKLVASCDACATKVCNADAFCCTNSWDAQCVSEVASICAQSCTGGGGGGGGNTCTHALCTSGAKLAKTCDACTTKVCNADAYCCTTAWDNVCVGEVASICNQTCP